MIRDLDDEKLIVLICEQYKFFKSLYPDKELTITGLAEKAGMKIPTVSKLVKRLDEKHDILKTRTQARERGRYNKYVELGEEVKRIMASIIEAVDPISKPKYSASKVKTLIKTLKDEGLPQDIRESAGYRLSDRCDSESEIEGGKEDLRKFFLEHLDYSDKYDENTTIQIDIALMNYIAYQLKDDKDLKWMKTSCYCKLIKIFNENENIKKRKRALKTLRKIYRVNELHKKQYELTDLIKERFFDTDENKDIANDCWDIIWHQADDEERDLLTDELSKMTKSDDEKTKERGSKYLKKVISTL